jgi:hypothetical protein
MERKDDVVRLLSPPEPEAEAEEVETAEEVEPEEDEVESAEEVESESDDSDESAPGWDAITQAFDKLYPGQDNPLHFGTLIKYAFGGNDPLDGISVYDGGEFWHYVTYGFTDLYEKENDNPDYSGFGFELTLKLKKTPMVTEDEMKSMCGVLQGLARYVFSSGSVFSPNEYIFTGQTEGMDIEQKSKLTGFVTTLDEVGEIDTPHGKMRFIQLIGATYDELKSTYEKKFTSTQLVEMVLKSTGGLTDLERASLIDYVTEEELHEKYNVVETPDDEDSSDLESNERLNELYNEIANQISSMIPVKWNTAYLLGQIEGPNRISQCTSLYYVEADSGNIVDYNSLAENLTDFVKNYSPEADKLRKSVLGIHKCYEDMGHDLWEDLSLKLEINEDDEFDLCVKFYYDSMNENDGGLGVRSVVWANKTFGYEPADQHSQQMLEQYSEHNTAFQGWEET